MTDEQPPKLATGQSLLHVDAFALTTNNVTYAVIGDALRSSNCSDSRRRHVGTHPGVGIRRRDRHHDRDVLTGTHAYGYLPTSTHLVVTPGRVDPQGFIDASPHRAGLPNAYNSYQWVDADPSHEPAFEDHRMVFPLFFTSFLIDDFLDDNSFFGVEAVVVSSSSSKTAIGAAFLLDQRKELEVVGLTSPRNVDFVDRLGVYHRVVPYDDLESLGGSRAAFVDIAGNEVVRAAVHHAYGDRFARGMMVGATHWDEPSAAPGDLPGPPPSFFFAPDQITKRTKDWGHAGLGDRGGTRGGATSSSATDGCGSGTATAPKPSSGVPRARRGPHRSRRRPHPLDVARTA